MIKKNIWLLSGILLLMIAVLISGCAQETKQTSAPLNLAIDKWEQDPAVWGKFFPDHYASYQKNAQGGMTHYGGADKVSKYEKEPLLPELFKGFGFAKEYNEDRGHNFALQDLKDIKRVTEKTTASCLTCKSTASPMLIEQKGMDYYTTPLSEVLPMATHGVSCGDCHDNKTMELTITRPAFTKAMERRGIDVTKASRQEMRSYVCAQCHVEYYFEPETKEVTFPWDKGFTPAEIEQYYQEIKPGFKDWEHPDSLAPMLKVQHPEFEMFQGSTHASVGLACADCHMPYTKVGQNKISSHHWTSPLKTIAQSCGTCHRQGEEWIKNRVNYVQSKTFGLLLEAQGASERAHKAIQRALATPDAEADLIKQAQEKLVQGQWRWDYVGAENSAGFHNPALALETLGKSISLSKDAELLAEKAIKK